jgi:6,7-dimethyl-8-ribityllumazine synthase
MATVGKDLSHYDKNSLPDASDMRIGIVVSEWNDDITENLFKGAHETLLDCGVHGSASSVRMFQDHLN